MVVKIFLVLNVFNVIIVNCYIINNNTVHDIHQDDNIEKSSIIEIVNEIDDKDFLEEKAANAFDGVYSECFLYLSYTCIQKKTLLYLNVLNNISEVSVIGDYVKFVKLNSTNLKNEDTVRDLLDTHTNSNDLSTLIDKAVDNFFDRHMLRISALGKDISVPRTVDEFVGRKKRKGGGGGGDHGGGHDGGKKKMMMMAMMCMKMKLMMMVPAMMGMMGMMSFKGMIFSMMSFMIAKMMLLMKILEKKGGGGGGGSGAGDGGWAAGGGGGGAWMPAGGPDYGGGSGGGGYDANGQWQSRSIPEYIPQEEPDELKPIIHSVAPIIRYNNEVNRKKPLSVLKALNDFVTIKNTDDLKVKSKHSSKSRKKRGIIDTLQQAYDYWKRQLLGYNNINRQNGLTNQSKYKIINGIKYVYYPIRYLNKAKLPKAIQFTNNNDVTTEEIKTIITAEDFDKGEIVEGGVESRMNKKFKKISQTMNNAVETDPWQ